MIWQTIHEPIQSLLVHHRARRIIRIGDEDQTCVLVNGIRHSLKIVNEIRIRHLHILGTKQSRHQLINHKGVLCSDQLRLGIEKTMAQQLNDLVGSITQHHILQAQVMMIRQGLPQLVAATIRIDVHPCCLALHRLDRRWRWP